MNLQPAEPAESQAADMPNGLRKKKRSDFKALTDKQKARLQQAFDTAGGEATVLRTRLALDP